MGQPTKCVAGLHIIKPRPLIRPSLTVLVTKLDSIWGGGLTHKQAGTPISSLTTTHLCRRCSCNFMFTTLELWNITVSFVVALCRSLVMWKQSCCSISIVNRLQLQMYLPILNYLFLFMLALKTRLSKYSVSHLNYCY